MDSHYGRDPSVPPAQKHLGGVLVLFSQRSLLDECFGSGLEVLLDQVRTDGFEKVYSTSSSRFTK